MRVGIFYWSKAFSEAGARRGAKAVTGADGRILGYMRVQVVNVVVDATDSALLFALDLARPMPGESVMSTHEVAE